MKLLCIVVLILGVSIAEEIPEFLQYKEGDRYFFFPTKDGKLELVDTLATDPNNRFDPEVDIIYYLNTRENRTNSQVITLGDVESLQNSNFDSSKPVKITTHGWTGDSTIPACTLIRDEFLDAMDVNVICVDWGVGASGLYPAAVANVAPTGQHIARMIDWLIEQGSTLDQFHVLGFSLGGHVVGHVGRNIRAGKIPYITALDPAYPLWGADSGRISPDDADYVEIIHTNVGNLGLADPVGHNDFYPNGGKNMPGCSITSVGCSHGRSVEYFAYSIDNTKFMANECAGYFEEIAEGFCSNLSLLHLGGASPKEARGTFYLETTDTVPYYLD